MKAMVTLLRRTMAPVCPLSLSRWETRPIIGTDRPTKGFRTAPRPCWSKRNQHLGIASVIMPTVGDKLSEPEKCARGPGMHRAGRGHHSGHSDDHLAHRFDATSSITSPRWLKRRQNQGQLAGSQSDVQRRLRLYGSSRGTHCACVWRGFARCCRVRAQEASPSPHGGRRLTGGDLRDVSGCSSRV